MDLTVGVLALKAELGRLDEGVRLELACCGRLHRQIESCDEDHANIKRDISREYDEAADLTLQLNGVGALVDCCKAALRATDGAESELQVYTQKYQPCVIMGVSAIIIS